MRSVYIIMYEQYTSYSQIPQSTNIIEAICTLHNLQQGTTPPNADTVGTKQSAVEQHTD